MIGAMPNTNPPITNEEHLRIAQKVHAQNFSRENFDQWSGKMKVGLVLDS